jgi:plastocyanin
MVFKNYLRGLALSLCTLCLMPAKSLAAEFSVMVLDQDGQAVANAVIESPGLAIANAPAEIAIIAQVNKRFVPMVIAIQRGQRVNFPNNDNIRHHVYSFSEIKQFSTELYADVPGEPVLFDRAGVAVLGCNIHDSMIGYIFVSDWQNVAVTDVSGRVHFSQDIIPDEIKIWHPWSDDPDNQRVVDTSSITDGGTLEIRLSITNPEKVFGFRALSSQ